MVGSSAPGAASESPADTDHRTTEITRHLLRGGSSSVIPPSTLWLAPPNLRDSKDVDRGRCAGGMGGRAETRPLVEARSK
ncbi:hypothetical protein OGATHE_001652 [Ogataea polymorpha]|uniref:Uncharacterized protein n=1 Tax=Ogataea polymorpha TaxID=460523 RepID=A0A9P8PPL7_9ASCO|nr:hypothetical protein OGATHE_001652 [Ogataea polymorpha]